MLEENGVDLVAVSIGTFERSRDFVYETGFPAYRLFADPDAAAYEALRLNKSLKNFSQKSTPEGIMERFRKDRAADLIGVLKRWKPWIPPKREQGFQQGGVFAFEGDECVYQFYDPSTGVHAPFDDWLVTLGVGPLESAPEPVPRPEKNKNDA